MKPSSFVPVFLAGSLLGCMAGGPPLTAQAPPPSVPAAARVPFCGAPLILDRTDLRLGTTVHFGRIPDLSELHDLQQLPGLAHVVLALPAWPTSFAQIQALDQLPQEADLIAVLPGYPPSREAAGSWDLLGARARIVMIVDGPPPSIGVVADLNAMRGLERVIAQMDLPSRSGFERLQRPLSFRKVME